MKVAILLLLAVLPLHAQAVLRLEDVIASVERAYPPLLAAIQDREIAEGDMLTALGRFDLNLRLRADADQFGFYDNERIDASLEQATAFQGASFFTGWRLGDGNFATYDGKLQTRSLGEFRAGGRLPLFRDRSIDQRRADLKKADLNRKVATLSIDQQKLVIIQLATRRYWDWLAAGRRLQVAQALLDLAAKRNEILAEGVRLGQLPAIEVTENERAILQRRSQVVEAERGLQEAGINLSLFYRDAGGKPLIPEAAALPIAFPDVKALTEPVVREDVETALKRRPEMQRFIVQRQQNQVDSQLAKNQLLPNIDLLFSFTSEAGTGSVKRGPQELKASLLFELPLQRRTAEGRLRSAEAKLTQLDHRARFQQDQIVAEVQDAISAVQAAYRRVQLLRDEVKVARQLEDMERSRFDLGDGTLFLVNLREQATFDAAVREVSAQAEYFRAQALYELAIAEALAPTRTKAP